MPPKKPRGQPDVLRNARVSTQPYDIKVSQCKRCKLMKCSAGIEMSSKTFHLLSRVLNLRLNGQQVKAAKTFALHRPGEAKYPVCNARRTCARESTLQGPGSKAEGSSTAEAALHAPPLIRVADCSGRFATIHSGLQLGRKPGTSS